MAGGKGTRCTKVLEKAQIRKPTFQPDVHKTCRSNKTSTGRKQFDALRAEANLADAEEGRNDDQIEYKLVSTSKSAVQPLYYSKKGSNKVSKLREKLYKVPVTLEDQGKEFVSLEQDDDEHEESDDQDKQMAMAHVVTLFACGCFSKRIGDASAVEFRKHKSVWRLLTVLSRFFRLELPLHKLLCAMRKSVESSLYHTHHLSHHYNLLMYSIVGFGLTLMRRNLLLKLVQAFISWNQLF